MTQSTDIHRILSMHPGHERIGVSGKGTIFHPYCSTDRPAAETVRVRLVSHPSDPCAAAALAALEPIVRRRERLECERMDFDLVEGDALGLPNVDCTVLFARGLHVVSIANFDLERVLEDAWIVDAPIGLDDRNMEMAVSVVSTRHPVLDRVGPFNARPVSRRFGDVLDDAACLLEGRLGGELFPVAWARDYRGRVFRTLLGASDDFSRPDFVRLVLNAIEWAGG